MNIKCKYLKFKKGEKRKRNKNLLTLIWIKRIFIIGNNIVDMLKKHETKKRIKYTTLFIILIVFQNNIFVKKLAPANSPSFFSK